MLARLGPPPKEPTLPRPPRQRVTDDRDEDAADDYQDRPIQALVENGGRMKAEELFANARYKKDQTREFASYYLALRDKIGKTIRLAGSDGESLILEVIPHEA